MFDSNLILVPNQMFESFFINPFQWLLFFQKNVRLLVFPFFRPLDFDLPRSWLALGMDLCLSPSLKPWNLKLRYLRCNKPGEMGGWWLATVDWNDMSSGRVYLILWLMGISVGISGCTRWVFVGSLLVKAGSDGNFSGTWVFHGTSD